MHFRVRSKVGWTIASAVIYLTFSLACRTINISRIVTPTETTVPTRTARPTFTATSEPTRTPTATLTIVIAKTAIKTTTKTPTRKLSPPPPSPIKIKATPSPWPFILRERVDADGQGTFTIRVSVKDANGVPINAYRITLSGTGLESSTIRYTGIGEPEGEVGFSPLGGYVCPESFNGLYFVTIYSEDTTGNKQLSAHEAFEFRGCAGGKGKILLRFSK